MHVSVYIMHVGMSRHVPAHRGAVGCGGQRTAWAIGSCLPFCYLVGHSVSVLFATACAGQALPAAGL